MIFTPLEKLGAALLLVLTLVGAEQAYEHHLIQVGVKQEAARRDKLDAIKKEASDKELARLAGLLAQAKATLVAAQADLETKKKELNDAQNRNANLQSDLAAGRRSLRILTRGGSCQTADPESGPAGRLDSQPAAEAELDGQVAANLVGLVGEGDSAIRRLNACIVKYNALEKAVNTVGEENTNQEK